MHIIYTYTYTLRTHTPHTLYSHYTHTHNTLTSSELTCTSSQGNYLTTQNVQNLTELGQNVLSGKWDYLLSIVSSIYRRKKIFNYKFQ